eukprot:1156108-Pelagomonas_calceolata.AAC.6
MLAVAAQMAQEVNAMRLALAQKDQVGDLFSLRYLLPLESDVCDLLSLCLLLWKLIVLKVSLHSTCIKSEAS